MFEDGNYLFVSVFTLVAALIAVLANVAHILVLFVAALIFAPFVALEALIRRWVL
jgi:hypothetical protein